jgi:uncharacterized ParB-like nuclease family protein
MLNIKLISIDKGTQPRAEISQETVDDYALALENGDKFPPVTVFNDGVFYYLADGFHRYFAHLKLGRAGIHADVVAGTLRDAKLYSYKANQSHGLRPSMEDKRKIVLEMLNDLEWSKWSDREIAKHCGVSHPFVGKLRASLVTPKEAVRKFTDGGGVTRERKVKPKPVETLPETSENDEMVNALIEENEKLTEQLALASIDGTVDDKNRAEKLIAELKEDLRIAKIEIVAVTKSRDQFQSENAQLKRQVAMLQKKLKQYE